MCRKISIGLFAQILLICTLSAQLNESFSGTTFPPEAWRVINYDGASTLTWRRATSNFNTAPACAACNWDDFNLTNDDWLVTPRLNSITEDTLSFNYRTFTTAQESIEVHLSLKGPTVADFTNSITGRVLWTRRINNISYHQVKIPLHQYLNDTFYIGFRYYVGYPFQPIGDGIYIDDISGPPLFTAHDVGVTQILAPISITIDSILVPSARLKNFGSFQETIPVIFKITDTNDITLYEKCDTIKLSGGVDTVISFTVCTLGFGKYKTISYTSLLLDANNSNDTCKSNFTVSSINVWQKLDSFPKKVRTSGSSICTDDNYLYCIRPSDSSFYAYDLSAGLWQRKRGVLTKPKTGSAIVYGGNDTVYALMRYKRKFYKYSVLQDMWLDNESIPLRQKSNPALYAQNGYVYCLIGDTTFLRYSSALHTWQNLKGLPLKLKSGAALSGDSSGCLYALRGSTIEFYRYSIGGNSWAIIESTPVKAKKGAGLTSDGYNIYFLASGRTRKFYRYNPVNKWRELDSTPDKVTGGSSITFTRGSVYCIRGSNSASFWRYIPDTNHTEVDLPFPNKNIQSSEIQNISIRKGQTYLVYNSTGALITKVIANSDNFKSSIWKNLPNGIYLILAEKINGDTREKQKLVIIK